MNDFLQHTFPHQALMEGDLLDAGEKMVVYGESEAGKSFLVLQLALSLATATPFLGYDVYAQNRVLIIQSELSPRRYQERCQKMARSYSTDVPIWIWTVEDLKIDTPEGVARMVEVIDSVQPHVVIIDPLRAFFQGNENDSDAVERMFLGAAQIQKKSNTYFSLIYAHHTRKTAPGFTKTASKSEVRGSSLITDRPSTAMGLEINDTQTEWRLNFTKTRNRHKRPPALTLTVNYGTGLFEVEGETNVINTYPELIEYIGEGKSQGDVAKWLMVTRGISRTGANKYLERAIFNHAVDRVKPDPSVMRYDIVPAVEGEVVEE